MIDKCNHITEDDCKSSVKNFVSKKYLKDDFMIFVCCKNCSFELKIPKSDNPVRICKCIVICME